MWISKPATYLLPALAISLGQASPAVADFINTPFSSGLSAVSISGVYRDPGTGLYDISGPVFDATGKQLHIGSSPVPGGASLTINNQVGTYNVIGIDNLGLVSIGSNSSGTLNIDGAGAFVNGNLVWLGQGNSAQLNITNGGAFSGERTFVGMSSDSTPPGDVTVTVDGAGSRWETETITIGSSMVPSSSSTHVQISDGGVLSAGKTPGDDFSRGQIYVGGRDGLGQSDSLTVTGTGSAAVASDFLGVIGGAGNDVLNVLDGGSVTAPTISIGAASRDGSGAAAMIVAGQDAFGVASSANINGDLTIGFGPTFVGFDAGDPVFAPADGSVTVQNGGQLNVGGAVNVSNGADGVNGRLTLGTGGTVNGNVNVNAGGVLDGDGGNVFGSVAVNGGTLAPGASPGSLYIDGDLDLFGALVELEIGGTAPGLFDSLTVGGDLFADAATVFRFTFFGGFSAQEGDTFDLFDVGGVFDFSEATFDFSALGGVATSLFSDGPGLLSLRLGEPAVPPVSVPEPSSWLLLMLGLGLLTARRRGILQTKL